MAVGRTGRAQALGSHHRFARRHGEPTDSGDEENHQRRRAAALAVASGFGEASRSRTLSAARPVRATWRLSTTGGHGIAEKPSQVHAWKPSPAERCCLPVWGEPSNMQDRQRCI